MSDTTTEATETETTDTSAETTTTETVDWEKKYKEMQQHSREWEKRAKAAEPAAKKLSEIEEANKSELEKAQAALAAAEKRAQETELASLRASVALEKGLTPTQAKRLIGSTREELEADADELLEDIKNTKPAAAPSTDGQGKTGEPVGQTKQITSQDELNSMTNQEIVQARKDGRLDQLLGVKSK